MGCSHDGDGVFAPVPQNPGAPQSPDPPVTPNGATFPSFVPDPPEQSNALRLKGLGGSEDSIDLSLWWERDFSQFFDPNSIDLLLNIDPEAEPERLGQGATYWCSGGAVEVRPTGSPGQWRIRRLGTDGYGGRIVDPAPSP